MEPTTTTTGPSKGAVIAAIIAVLFVIGLIAGDDTEDTYETAGATGTAASFTDTNVGEAAFLLAIESKRPWLLDVIGESSLLEFADTACGLYRDGYTTDEVSMLIAGAGSSLGVSAETMGDVAFVAGAARGAICPTV